MKDLQKTYESLINLQALGGENSLNTNITAKFHDSNTSSYIGRTQVTIKNTQFPTKDYIEPLCIESECITSQGIWTTALITSRSIVLGNTTYYWVQGAVDTEGRAWIADIGFLGIRDFSVNIVDNNVPVSSSGEIISKSSIGAGIKYCSIKKVSRFSVEVIHNVIGPTPNTTLIRATKGIALNYNHIDQTIPLDYLALGLLSLLDEDYLNNDPCIQVFGNDISDPKVSSIIRNSNTILLKLLDPTPTGRFNSVVHNLTSYINPSDLFGTRAEALYKNPVIIPVDRACLGEDCIANKTIITLSDRSVSNLSIAWLIIYLCEYVKTSADTLPLTYLSDLTSYLVGQVDATGYVYKGWTDAQPISQSEQIADTSIDVNVISLCALLKAFEVLDEPNHLDKALQIKDYLFSNLYVTRDKLFKLDPYSSTINSKSCLYGLILSIIVDRPDISKSIYDYLLPLVSLTSSVTSIVTDGGVDVTDGGVDVVDTTDLNGPLFTTLGESYSDTELEVLNLLFIESLEYLDPILQLDSTVVDAFDRYKNTDFTSLLGLSLDLRTSNLFTRIVSNQVRYVNSLDFNRYRLYNLASSFYPTNYSWASEKALTIKGNLGKLLLSLTRPAALLYVLSLKSFNSSSLSKCKGYELDRLAYKEYGITRRVRESDVAFIARIKTLLSKSIGSSTKQSLVTKLENLNITTQIKEKYEDLANFNNLYTKAKELGQSYLQGNSYTYSSIDVEIDRHVDSEVFFELSNAFPIATKRNVTQAIHLSACNQVNQDRLDYLSIEVLINGGEFILNEEGGYILDEDGCPIRVEDGSLVLLNPPSALSLSVTCNPSTIQISWTASTSTIPHRYKVEASVNGGAYFIIAITSLTSTSHLVQGNSLTYKVTTIDVTNSSSSTSITSTIQYSTQCTTLPPVQ